MTPEDWQRVRPILESALELDPAGRARFLDKACADSSLRREVESLIAFHEEAGPDALEPGLLLNLNPDDEARFRLPPGKRIGVYEILEEIAVGGMGAVYRATRADGQYQQQVAVKIVRSELGAESTAARFRNERQILASLDHPNIAKILDGGTTSDGLPYFVMEFINGLTITDYCDRNKLSIDDRLTVFRTVCSAVHYAHQHLVIHRDIKPGNILVTPDGVPKLLDFGIAKILDPSLLPESAAVTIAGLWVMTPEYASPEQLRGDAITTATDVYSLGLVLYELLTGHRAYRFSSHLPHEIARAVLETDPEKPSTAIHRRGEITEQDKEKAPRTPELLSGLRGDSLERLHQRISGDLDNIVLKAIRKEPRERYSSADQLSEDIRRHMEHLPVVARKSTVAYRCRKYVLRHKVGVTAAALVFLSLLIGIVLTLREARIARANQLRAERRFNDVRSLANSLMFEIHDSIKDLPGSTPSRKLLVSRALEYLDSLNQEAKGDVSLQRELAAAYEKIGDVQGQPRQANLGDSAGAENSYRKGLAILESLVATNPKLLDLRRELVPAYGRLSDLLWSKGDFTGTMEHARKGLAVSEGLYRADAANPANRLLMGLYWIDYGFKQALVAGDRAGGLECLQKGSAMLEQIASEDPKNVRVRRLLGLSYSRTAAMLEGDASDRPQALKLYEKSIRSMQGLLDSDPNNTDFGRIVAYGQTQIAQLLANMGESNSAVTMEREALSSFQKLAAADPANLQFRQDVAQTREQIGEILEQQGDLANALKELNLSLGLLESLPDAKNPQSQAGYVYVSDQYWLGKAHVLMASSSKNPAEHFKVAESWFQKCLPGFKLLRDQGSPQHKDPSRVVDIEKEIVQCNRALGRKRMSTSP
jgi:serine/threonine protein kinase